MWPRYQPRDDASTVAPVAASAESAKARRRIDRAPSDRRSRPRPQVLTQADIRSSVIGSGGPGGKRECLCFARDAEVWALTQTQKFIGVPFGGVMSEAYDPP